MKALSQATLCIAIAMTAIVPLYAADRSKAQSPDGRLTAWLKAKRWAVS